MLDRDDDENEKYDSFDQRKRSGKAKRAREEKMPPLMRIVDCNCQ